ncbi:hypothetical protein pipiens_007491 [Culex pipiens pipiens]|uniref:MADF domain-containing protein n=1 Tax=Culex pipiens pipiens TaxID=38569 RepID=A0ABD1DLB3_CULPP
MRMAINTPEDSTVNERFIKLVEETPILWNLHMPMYRNREMKEQKWAEVGAPFNLSGSEAYKKFVALREKYKREQKLRDSKGLSQTECWRLYDKFKFLDTVSFSRDRRWNKPKLVIQQRQHGSFPMASLAGHNFVSMIKSEFPELQSNSTATSPSYHMSGEPSENESNGGEPFQDNSEYFNDSMTHGRTSEGADGAEFGERSESIPDVAPQPQSGPSQEQQFLNRLELKTNAILDEQHNRRKDSWARCETLGHRVAQTMFALEENDPDLALRFDIIMSEAITSIKKDQLQRLMARQQQGEEHRRQMELQMRLQQQQSDRTGPAS